jgi:peptide/nickel transport system permease protein
MLLSLFVVATLIFMLFRVLPGDPTSIVVSPEFTQAQREELLAQYGLDKPVHIQYLLFLKNLAQGNLGYSFQTSRPVTPFILGKALNTIVITVPAILLAFTVGPLLGAYFAWHRNSFADTVGSGALLAAYAAPIFWTGMLAIMLFSFNLQILPSGGMRSIGYVNEGGILDPYLSTDFLKHALLPLTVFFMWRVSLPLLIMRNNMLDTLGSEFIELKETEGLPEWKIIYKHGARNSLLPVLHYSALALGFAFGGSVILETVFSWPGVGLAMWNAVFARDYPVAQAAFLLVSVIIITFNFLVDIVSVYVDPRVADSEVET